MVEADLVMFADGASVAIDRVKTLFESIEGYYEKLEIQVRFIKSVFF